MLWDQHRVRYEVGGVTVRFVTYTKFMEIIRASEITDADMAAIGRLNAKRQSGDTLTQEETDRLTTLAARWPLDELRGACLVPPRTAQETRDLLASMPRRESEELEAILDKCAGPDIDKDDVADPLALALIRTGGLGIDMADMTAGQGMAVAEILGGGQRWP